MQNQKQHKQQQQQLTIVLAVACGPRVCRGAAPQSPRSCCICLSVDGRGSQSLLLIDNAPLQRHHHLSNTRNTPRTTKPHLCAEQANASTRWSSPRNAKRNAHFQAATPPAASHASHPPTAVSPLTRRLDPAAECQAPMDPSSPAAPPASTWTQATAQSQDTRRQNHRMAPRLHSQRPQHCCSIRSRCSMQNCPPVGPRRCCIRIAPRIHVRLQRA